MLWSNLMSEFLKNVLTYFISSFSEKYNYLVILCFITKLEAFSYFLLYRYRDLLFYRNSLSFTFSYFNLLYKSFESDPFDDYVDCFFYFLPFILLMASILYSETYNYSIELLLDYTWAIFLDSLKLLPLWPSNFIFYDINMESIYKSILGLLIFYSDPLL